MECVLFGWNHGSYHMVRIKLIINLKTLLLTFNNTFFWRMKISNVCELRIAQRIVDAYFLQTNW